MSSSTPSGIVTTNDNERVIPATRRPDGTVRKERRVRQGYVPQEDVARYKNPWVEEVKPKPAPKPELPKTKAQKKNEKRKLKKKEEREKEGNLEGVDNENQQVVKEDSLDQIQDKITKMSINKGSESPVGSTEENSTTIITIEQLENNTKKIKALEKKIRQIERIKEKKSPLNPDEEEKLSKLEQFLEELKILRQGNTE